MEFTASLKEIAQRIIELSSRLGDRTHTWNQEKFAPNGGYTDRAGFVVFDDIELFADVYSSEDETKNLLRARLALSPKNNDNQDLFTIITLDFSADAEKINRIISDANNLSAERLIALLNDLDTQPKLVQVSLESGKDSGGNPAGKRYEYTADDLKKLTEADQAELLSTLDQAYNHITSNV